MSNSGLVSYTKISPNKTSPRNRAIDTITIHCMAGNMSLETCGNLFSQASRQASSNYGIDSNGNVALYVDENDRSWASSNSANDHRAVTIEVANNGGAPDWPVSDAAYSALINLVADICQRNGIKRLVWSTSKDDRVNHRNGCNMTVHRDFAAKACPGDYLYERHGDIAAKVNSILDGDDMTQEQWDAMMENYLARMAKQPASSWATAKTAQHPTGIMEEAKAKGITDGTRPKSLATREEVAAMVNAISKG